MILSINPTYYCNFKCDFCYLTKNQLDDKTLLPLNILKERIEQVLQYETIDMVDLYGGEIGLLSNEYINGLTKILNDHQIYDINIITNLSALNKVILNPDFYITVSYDFDCREQHDRVWNNMISLNREFSILLLASEGLIKKDVDSMIQQLNLLTNLKSVEIKPYSSNQSNHHNISFLEFENFVKNWIKSPIKKSFEFVNENNILESLNNTRNAFSNDHVYITPNGNFAVLEFDLNDREYFKELSNFEKYLEWANKEPEKNISDICKNCDYYGRCLTEHYRYVRDLKNSCNGFKGLLDWYAGKL